MQNLAVRKVDRDENYKQTTKTGCNRDCDGVRGVSGL
jgi:hypothetical protein